MKRSLFVFLITLFFIPSLACGFFRPGYIVGSGNIVSKSIAVSGFDRITLEGSGDVYVEQGRTESLSVEADDNILPLLDEQVRGNELVLRIKPGYDVTPSQSITYHITIKDLSGITTAGSGDFFVGPVESDTLAISIPGSGDVRIESLTGDKLSIDLDGSGSATLDKVDIKTSDTSIQGSGDVKLTGKAEAQGVTIAGSGNYLAGDLETETANISVVGSAHVTVWVNDQLEIKNTGSANVEYYGKPSVDESGVGSGDLVSLGDK
jgi:hypothetical protein